MSHSAGTPPGYERLLERSRIGPCGEDMVRGTEEPHGVRYAKRCGLLAKLAPTFMDWRYPLRQLLGAWQTEEDAVRTGIA